LFVVQEVSAGVCRVARAKRINASGRRPLGDKLNECLSHFEVNTFSPSSRWHPGNYPGIAKLPDIALSG
jgi:hypothetical protein